jgi:hypothetical protein
LRTRLPRVSFQENTKQAEGLAWALSATITQEIHCLQPARQAEIKFLEAVSAMLDGIAGAINEARRAATSKDREQEYAKAKAWAGSLAKVAREFAEVNHERLIDYGSYSVLVILGTELFANMFGVSTNEAVAARLVLLESSSGEA